MMKFYFILHKSGTIIADCVLGHGGNVSLQELRMSYMLYIFLLRAVKFPYDVNTARYQ